MDHIMGMLDDIAARSKDAFDTAVKFTGEKVSEQKIKLQIASIKSQLSKEYETLGRLYHDSMKHGNDNEFTIKAVIGEIEEKSRQVRKLQIQIDADKKYRDCKVCGCKNPPDSLYCNRCGKKF